MIGHRMWEPRAAEVAPLASIRGWEHWADALLLGGVLATTGTFLRPDLLLTATIPGGGDTTSHYATAVYLRDHLLPNGRLSGWMPGNYAGFPILQFYFPLSFLLIIALGLMAPFPVAFKLVTVLGTVALPLSTYLFARLLGFRFPAPVLTAGATLVFLLQGENSMWGGNIQSTLAGEFAFSLGFALTPVFLGTMWTGVMANRGAVLNAGLLALIGLAHGYTLLFAGFTTLVLPALARHPWAALRYLATVYGLAFCLLGVWLLPLLANLPFTTAFAPAWFIGSWTEILPRTFWPLTLSACLWTGLLLWRRFRRGARAEAPAVYLWYGIGISAAGYLLGPWLHVVDVRFIPFGQFLLIMLGAVGLSELMQRLRIGPVIAVAAVALQMVWSVSQAVHLSDWVRWNYAGLEQKPLWPAFLNVNRLLAGTPNDPRVVYEHSMTHNGAGSPRAFESLPLFSGRSTLEGLYLQASPTAPFVFYVQAELSHEASCPFSHVACTSFNPAHALRHLRLFNVREIVAVSDELKRALEGRPDLERVARIQPYEIYRFAGDDGRFSYVEPLDFEPLLVETTSWKETAYQWFRLFDHLDVPLVFPVNATREQLARFSKMTPDLLLALPRRRLARPDAGPVVARLADDAIEFDTPYVGHPHLIKVSYHPNWRVEGAETIFLAAPSFMLVYPESPRVRLWYGTRWPEHAGLGLTVAAVVAAGLLGVQDRKRRASAISKRASCAWERVGVVGGYAGAALPVVLLLMAVTLRLVEPPYHVLLNEGILARDRKEFDAAEGLFRRVIEQAPASGAAEQAAYYFAIVRFLQGDMEGTITRFRDMIRRYPSSPFVAEGYYHIGLAHLRLAQSAEARTAFHTVIEEFGGTAWARYAKDRLAELGDPPHP